MFALKHPVNSLESRLSSYPFGYMRTFWFSLLFAVLTLFSTAYAEDSSAPKNDSSAKTTDQTASDTTEVVEPPLETVTNNEASDHPQPESPWKGSNAQAGGVINTGNTDNQTYNGQVNIRYTYKKWVFTEESTYQRISNGDSGVTADRFFTQAQANYNLSDFNFIYLQTNYTRDLFSGFTYVVNTTLGYGRRIDVGFPSVTVDVFAGPGARLDQEAESGQNRQDPSLQMGTTINWNITERTTLQEQLQTTLAKDNTHSFSKTALITNLSDHFSFSIEYLITNDSTPAPGKLNVNTTTTINLVYNF